VPVRQLDPGEGETLRALRLEALLDSPGEFSSTYEREAVRTAEEWERWLAAGATFVYDDPSRGPVGLVAAVPDEDGPAVVWLMAMWVRPTARGTGAGGALVDAVVAWAIRHDATRVRLHVVENNAAARRLYERHGFRPTGQVERDGRTEVAMEARVGPGG
jgi:GNAT superfamily N-acetyltransferase